MALPGGENGGSMAQAMALQKLIGKQGGGAPAAPNLDQPYAAAGHPESTLPNDRNWQTVPLGGPGGINRSTVQDIGGGSLADPGFLDRPDQGLDQFVNNYQGNRGQTSYADLGSDNDWQGFVAEQGIPIPGTTGQSVQDAFTAGVNQDNRGELTNLSGQDDDSTAQIQRLLISYLMDRASQDGFGVDTSTGIPGATTELQPGAGQYGITRHALSQGGPLRGDAPADAMRKLFGW